MDRILALPVPSDLFFVDDDSPDGTGRLLDDLSALTPQLRVIHRPGKLGLGTAYREAYSALLKEDYAYFLRWMRICPTGQKILYGMLHAAE